MLRRRPFRFRTLFATCSTELRTNPQFVWDPAENAEDYYSQLDAGGSKKFFHVTITWFLVFHVFQLKHYMPCLGRLATNRARRTGMKGMEMKRAAMQYSRVPPARIL